MITAKPRFPIRAMIMYGWLPSFLKCMIYRLRGYRIGRRVKIGFGSVICAKEVRIADDVTVGFFSFIRGKRIQLGNRVQIGSMCFLDTPHLEIGDDSRLNEQVYVGGLQFPDSRLTVGKNCQIMQMTFINPTKYITIGDDMGIGGDSCCLVTHVIPSKCLATGTPSRVVGQAPYFPRKLRVGDRETILRDILAEMVEY